MRPGRPRRPLSGSSPAATRCRIAFETAVPRAALPGHPSRSSCRTGFNAAGPSTPELVADVSLAGIPVTSITQAAGDGCHPAAPTRNRTPAGAYWGALHEKSAGARSGLVAFSPHRFARQPGANAAAAGPSGHARPGIDARTEVVSSVFDRWRYPAALAVSVGIAFPALAVAAADPVSPPIRGLRSGAARPSTSTHGEPAC